MKFGWLALALAPLSLGGCGTDHIWASDEFMAEQVYVSSEPPSITLVTVISTATGGGAHSALVVNASQRVVFDPAGTFRHPNMPERYDVIFGVTDGRLQSYLSYHSRVTYYVVTQTLPVSAAVAEQALQLVKVKGPVPKANCANATSDVLNDLPGFEFIKQGFSPLKLMKQFGQIPGVVTAELHEADPDKRGNVMMAAP